ncbi:MAG: outer membrane protein assembly factor BamA [Candidatus Mesenet longicola]|uniref:Outer membrane protein assembly factor BamA n=1 Tax=Candidatus Mesenet longicola TaxID=1892558 RepID=A0A8J3HWK5_9RICK|nr:MAG: outer membrane protein assembly factor BamA [Candidatus Mesenet longicola]GHM59606.1 MAG: outer membrane protein assembly factor BamA [Candidatus Mesenet longicola]
MKNIIAFISILLIPFCLIASSNAMRQKVKAVEIIGNERLDYQTIHSYAKISDEIDDNDIDAIIKNLHKTGLFSNIEVVFNEKQNLIITLKENPIVNNIIIRGNRALSNKEIKNNILGLKPLATFTETKLKNDIMNLTSTYRNSASKLQSKVKYEIMELENNRIDIVLKIEEGRTSSVKRIGFIGNKKFSDNELKHVIYSKEYKAARIFNSNAKYLPERIMLDKALIGYFYSNKGYIDVVVNSVVEFDDNFDAYLTLLIEEGIKYSIGSIQVNVDSQLQNIEQEITKMLKIKSGEVFSVEAINGTAMKINKYLNDKGYIFAQVEPEYNKREGIVDISYKVSIGKEEYINRIDISGNNKTLDKVVRRQLSISEGDPYNILLVQKSRRKLINTGLFETVDIESNKLQDNVVNLNISVKEKSTSSFQVSGGFSSASGLMGNINIKERNLFGTGRELSFSLEKTALSFSNNIDFTENHIFDSDVSLGVGVFFSSQAQSIDSNFSSKNSGFITRLSYDITDNLSQSLRYSFKYNNIVNVAKNASLFIKEQEGENIDSSIGYTLTYNKLDNIYSPKNGYLLRASQDLSGFGGTLNYLKSEASFAIFKSILPKINDSIVLRFKGSIGYVFSYSDKELKIGQRFFIGMNEIRGFDLAGVGPRAWSSKYQDKLGGDALGGKFYFVGTTQADFPIGLPEYAGVKGSLFVDYGTLYGLDYKNKDYFSDNSLRISAGFGFSWNSPFGPMRLDFGFPLAKEPYDLPKVIRFSVDTGI